MSLYSSVARKRRESIFQINPNRPAKANFIITDLFTNIDEVTKKAFTSSSSPSTLKLFLTSHHILNPTVLLALILLGLLTAVVSFFMDLAIQELQYLRLLFIQTNSEILNMGIWIVFCIVLCELAVFITTYLSKDAEGSGIPEMKAILSGVKLKNFMSYKTFFAKIFGVVFAIGGGLSIGREGPFVHISGIIATHISKIPIFSHIHSNLTLKNQFLAAAVAAGIASVFECPIGGVLYSIEVTSTYYIVSNMWRAAFCSIWCAIGIIWLREIGQMKVIDSTDFPDVGLDLEIFSFIILGGLCGLLGALFINITSRLISLKEQNIYPKLYGRYRYTLLICIICAVVTFLTSYLRLNDMTVINDMFHSTFSEHGWDDYNLPFALLVFGICKFLLTSLSLSCHIPAGVLYPLLATGAVFGRLFQQLASFVFTSDRHGVYAAIGAASLVSATTHTISVAVIVFEFTGQIHYFLPMIVSVLIAYTVSSSLTLSIYDAFLEIKGLPYLPSLKPAKLQAKCARDIMEYSYPQITLSANLGDLVDAIEEASVFFNKIAVVDSEGNLLYDLLVHNAKEYFLKVYNERHSSFSPDTVGHLDNFLIYLERKNKESMMGETFENFLLAKENNEEVKKFLSISVDLKSEILNLDDSPFAINESTPLAKVHFLFIMLGLNQAYIIRKGALVGMISRESFTKSRNPA